MKIEEAIDILDSIEYENDEELSDAIEVVKESCEKQIPKSPILKIVQKYRSLGRRHYCQECGVMFIDWEAMQTNYCGNCGQKLRED